MSDESTQETIDREEFRKMIHGEMQNIWQIRLADDGNFWCDLSGTPGDEMGMEDLKKICMHKHPHVAFQLWIEKAFSDTKDNIREDIEEQVREKLQEHMGDYITYEQETWLRDYIRYYVVFQLPEEQYLSQRVQADVLVDTGDSAYSFCLNSRFLSDGENPSNGEMKPSIVWLAETLGYSEEQLKAELGMDAGKTYTKDSGHAVDKDETFLEGLKNLDFPMYASPLVFLAELTVGDLIEINSQMHERDDRCPWKVWRDLEDYPQEGVVHIKRGTTTLLFDPWFTGAGSLDSLAIEKDIDLPVKYIYSALPDGAEGKYSVKSVYSMQETAWQEATVGISGDDQTERVSIALLNELVKSWENDPKNAAKVRWWAWDKKADVYVAVDNSTGDAWTEEFDTPEQCLLWLKDSKLDPSAVKEMSAGKQRKAQPAVEEPAKNVRTQKQAGRRR